MDGLENPSYRNLQPPNAAMLAQSVLNEICRLLAEDELTQEQIAARMGVSRTTIWAIAADKRPASPPYTPEEEPSPPDPPARCPACGGLVYLPCLLCQLRGLASTVRPPESDEELPEPTRLELKPEHRRRYEEIRRQGAMP
jgi:hypothetical protein